MRRLGIVCAFCILSAAVLYAHLVLWPVGFELNQAAPFTITSPITFSYTDPEILADLSGHAEEGAPVRLVDPEALKQARARLLAFADDVEAIRRNSYGRRPVATADKVVDRLAKEHGVPAGLVSALLSQSEEGQLESVQRASDSLDQMMHGPVSQSLVDRLAAGQMRSQLASLDQLHLCFLQPNLVKAPIPEKEIQSLALAKVDAGDRIVSRGEMVDQNITARLEIISPQLELAAYYRLAAAGLLLLGAVLLWFQYLRRFGTPLLLRIGALVQYSSLFVAFLTIGLLLGRMPGSDAALAVVFSVAALGSIIALVYDAAFAAYLSLCLGAVLSVALSFDTGLVLYTLGGALLPSVILTPGCRRMVQLLFAFLMGGFNVFLAVIVSLAFGTPLGWKLLLTAFSAGGAAAVVAFGLLPVIEAISSQLTPGKLMELANPECELLKRLKRDAHGTYAHCQGVADLAEEACKEIGARWLHARVGALYHDIGKLKRPAFFAENIIDQAHNPHNGLPPESSVKILQDHVSDGLALARESHLPRELHRYIGEHHGTYLIRYFYNLALEQSRDSGSAPPDQADYCYPGPLPSTRESAVVMLADVVEAVFRSRPLADMSGAADLLDRIFAEKIEESQLVDSGITVGELAKVKAAFLRFLLAEAHQRPAYPIAAEPVLQFHFLESAASLTGAQQQD